MTSMRPFCATASMSSSTISWMRGRNPSTMRGVNALRTSLRSRVCSGGSEVSIVREAVAGPAAVGGEAGIGEHGDHVVVAGKHPRLHQRAPVDGVFGPQTGVHRIGVGVDLGDERVVLHSDHYALR